MPRRTSSIVAATCPRCDGSLELDEGHARFFTCRNCGTSLEDKDYGRGSPQVVNVTVARPAAKPLSPRARRIVLIGSAVFLVGIVALAVWNDDDADDRDRITLGSVVEDGDGLRVLATGTTFDGVVRAVSTGLDGEGGWAVDVAEGGSVQPRAAVGATVAYVLLERQLVGLDDADGSERFRIDLPNDLACPDCMVASGDDGRYVTLSLNGGTVATYSGDDGSLVSETEVGTGSHAVAVAGDAVAFITDSGRDVAFADPSDLAAATPLGLGCPDPVALPDEPEDGVDEILITAVDGDLVVQFDQCMGRWGPDFTTPDWRIDGVRALHGFAPGSAPDFVAPRGEGGQALVDLRDGSLHPIDVEPTSALVIGRTDGATTAVVREDGVWSIVAFEQSTGASRWRKTPPGDFHSAYHLGIQQQLPDGADAGWLAGEGGGAVHRVRHDADDNAVTVQQIDLRTGEFTDEVSVRYGDEDQFGLRLPVVLGFTDEGVVLTLDDRITHLDTATGEVLGEA